MKLWVIFALFVLFSSAYSEAPSCALIIQGDKINAIPKDGPLGQIYKATDVNSLSIKEPGNKYVDAQIQVENVTLTLQNMIEYHNEQDSTPNSKLLELEFQLICSNGAKQTQAVLVVWEFSNIYPPTINNNDNTITYQLPMPFPNINLGLFKPIIITDIDMYNTGISVALNVNQDKFDAACKEIADSKNKRFDISLTPKVFIQESMTLDMIVKDKPAEGQTPKSITITIQIEKLSDASMPVFEEASYSGNLKVDTLEFSTIDTKITFSEFTTFEINGEPGLKECLKLDPKKELATVSILLDTGSNCDIGKLYKNNVVIFMLNAKENDKLVSWTAITVDIIAKHFEKSAYVYEFTSDDFELTDIKLLDVVDRAEISIQSEELNCLLHSNRKEIKCILKEELSQSMLKTEIKALVKGRPESAVTTNVIIYSSSPTDEKLMQFTEVIYEGVVDTNKNVMFDPSYPELLNVIGKPRFEIDKHKDVFEFKWMDNKIELTINKIPDELNVASFTLTASSNESNKKAHSEILLKIKHEISTEYDIKFSDILYKGKMYKDNNNKWHIKINNEKKIEIISNHTNVEVFIDEKDPHKTNFYIKKMEDMTYDLIVADDIDFSDEHMISFILFAKAGNKSGYTVIFLLVSQTIEIPTKITFEKYQIAHNKRQTETAEWEVVYIKAISEKDKEFNYKLKGKDCPHAATIHKSSGLVQIKGTLAVGTYTCNIIATGTISKATAETPLVLVVFKNENIPPTDYQAEFSHVVIYLNEDQSEDQIVLKKPGLQEEYGYCIKNSIPHIVDNPNIFYVKDGTVMARKFKREIEELEDMKVPQFTVTLKAIELDDIGSDGKCPPLKYKRSIEGVVMEDANTLTSPKETIVSIIINDINNNVPEMERTHTVGYPSKFLVDFILPPFLTKLHATDKDSKESGYGKLSYASLSPNQIVVNPTTGEVYPTKAMYDDERHEYAVQACDPDPNHCVEMLLEVILLSSEQMATLVVEKQIEEIENMLNEVSEQTDVRLSALSVSTVYDIPPASVLINPFLREETNPRRTVSAVIYALNKTSNTPLKTSELQELFIDKEIIAITDLVLHGGNQIEENSSESYNDTGLIVTMSVLAVLFVGTLIVGAVVFRRIKQNVGNEIIFSKCLYNGELYKDDYSSWKVRLNDENVINITSDHPGASVMINENDQYHTKFNIKKNNNHTFEISVADYEDFSNKDIITFTVIAKVGKCLGFTTVKLVVSEKSPEGASQFGFTNEVFAREEKEENAKEDSNLDKTQFVKSARSVGVPNKSIGRRATGYFLNAPSILDNTENTSESMQSTLPPYKFITDEDDASVITQTTSKSVKFNSHSNRIEVPDEDDVSD